MGTAVIVGAGPGLGRAIAHRFGAEGFDIALIGRAGMTVDNPPFASIAAASGALRNWVLNLDAELKPRGVYAAHVAIATWIGREGPASQPEAIAETYREPHRRRQDAERLCTAGSAS